MKTITCMTVCLYVCSLSAPADMARPTPTITGIPVVKSTIGLVGPGIPDNAKSDGVPHIQWLVADTQDGPFSPMPGVTGPRCVIGANLATKWLKARIEPVDKMRESGNTMETKSVQVKDCPGNPNVDFMANNPLGLSFTFDREYIKRCAANAAEQIQKKADGSEESWDQTLATFDVAAFANEVKSTGAGYVIFALGQNSGYYCAPNATIEKAAGVTPHTLCSKRDLPLEIMRALKPYHIPVILYLPGNPPNLNAALCKSMDWNGSAPTQATVACWNKAIEEWSLHYGTELAGWWIDGMWYANVYAMTNPENWHSRAAALKAGNPACAITLNEGGKMHTPCPYIDMTDGESNNLGPVPKHGRWADPVNRVQWFIYTFIGANDPHYAGWGNKGVCRTAKDLDAWLGRVFARGGAVTLDVKVNRFGRIDPEQLKLLKDTPACHGVYPKLDPALFNDDHEAITYTGNWVAYGERPGGDYEDDVHATDRNGDSFIFTFVGTGVEMIGEKNVDLGDIELSLDGRPLGIVNCKAATKSTQQSLFVSHALPKSRHTLKGVKKNGGYMLTDLFKIKP